MEKGGGRGEGETKYLVPCPRSKHTVGGGSDRGGGKRTVEEALFGLDAIPLAG